MEVEVLVLDESSNTFKTKSGEQKTEVVLSVRDASAGSRCLNNFSYALANGEMDAFGGKLRDNKVKIDVKNMMVRFDGSIRLVGHLVLTGRPVVPEKEKAANPAK